MAYSMSLRSKIKYKKKLTLPENTSHRVRRFRFHGRGGSVGKGGSGGGQAD